MTAWTRATSRLAVGLALAVAMAGSAYAQGRGGRGQAPEPEPLRWRFMGPSVGNRIAAVAGVPGDPITYYAGAASGGVWKSTDGGATFVADLRRPAGRRDRRARRRADRPQRSVWAGTGEAWVIRDERRDRRRHLQVHRRRRDLDAHGPRRDRPHRPHHRPPDRSRTSSTSARSGGSPVRSRSAASSRPPTAADLDAQSLFVDPNTGCSGLVDGRERSERADGRHVAGRDAHAGRCSAAGRAAASTSRTTAARSGRRSTHTGCRSRRSARSTSPSRRRTRSASTR